MREIILHYQPQVNLETGTVTGAEILIRWTRSDFHLDYPTQFVNIAENRDLILPIGKWVLGEACHLSPTPAARGPRLRPDRGKPIAA